MKLKLSFLNVFAIILFLYFAFIAIKDPDEWTAPKKLDTIWGVFFDQSLENLCDNFTNNYMRVFNQSFSFKK